MTSENAAPAVIIDVADLAQLFIAEAEKARPGRPFRLLLDELLDVLGEVGADRLPKTINGQEGLVRVALDVAHRAAPRAE